VQLNPDDNKVVVVNTSLTSFPKGMVKLTCFSTEGMKLFSEEQPVTIAPNSLTPCFVAEYPDNLPAVYLIRLELYDRPKHVISVNDYLKTKEVSGNFSTINTKATILVTRLKEEETKSDRRYTFTLVNDSKRPAYAVKLNLKNAKTGETILPAYFSDGYFNLLPGEKKEVSVDFPTGITDSAEVVVSGYNL
jgi:hypothetical protein